MTSTRTFILTNSPFTLDQIALASFVPNIKQPHQDAERPYAVQPTDYDIQPDESFDLLCKTGSESRLTAVVSKLASVFVAREKDDSLRVTAQKGHVYSLRQPTKLFRQIVFGDAGSEDMQRWLEDCKLHKLTPRFVVGYRTFTDARLDMGTQRRTEFQANATVPVGALGGDVTGLGDVGAGSGSSSKKSAEVGMVPQGERIYAICYRKVDLAYCEGKLLSSLALKNNWEAFAAPRGANDDEDEDAEALEDTYVKADLQAEDDDGGCTTYSVQGVVESRDSELFAVPSDF